MSNCITKQQILNLIKNQNFKTEDEFRDFLIPKLAILFRIKEEQIDKEPITTSFDKTLSNRADIIIRNDDYKFKKAYIVFELKLSKNVDKFKGGDYSEPEKQLKKYCQDTRAPYGVLLTEDFCAIWRNKYFSYDQEPNRIDENKIPSIKNIEDIIAKESLLDFFLQNKSTKYLFLSIILFFVLLVFVEFLKIILGITNIFGTMLLSFILGSISGLISFIIFKIRKTFD